MPALEDTMTVDGLREQLIRLFATLNFIVFFQAFIVQRVISTCLLNSASPSS